MGGKALGLIEVNGLVGAIEAADSALKAADVKLLGVEKISSGLTTVKIIGDVAAVQEAVAVAKIAVSKISSIFSSTVISKMDNQTEAMILNSKDKTKKIELNVNSETLNCSEKTEEVINSDIAEINISEVTEVTNPVKIEDEILIEKVDKCEEKIEEKIELKEKKVYTIIEIKAMNVEELRRLARQLKITEMNNKQIKFAKKDRLIEVIDKHYREGDK
ncbi:BMC domain-containing protein [Clostridium gasigenes]|uniref:Energy-coupling factor transport system substrate-specific component n=1 Tax=Clostridium gasigenes TaxID=94869 RepID=A0A1H0VB04_9CLOT|nr:BMC domain-containing protein [Clostridium gasigenes]MBB6624356.1 BMC domain-containing protein [Clostridium gasigenes]MBU3088749.1 BMC domain-containing protein [Clostridium gasigenes]SDP75553.1 energy-coupling factor transport system substrate-specific component [Clostridium gasigenes]